MAHLLLDVEVQQPLPIITVGDDQDGMAVLVRRHGRPIGFFMEAVPPGTTISADGLARRISREVARDLIWDALRGPSPPGPTAPSLPPVTVAICTRDRHHWLDRCLQSLRPLRGRAERAGTPLDLVVVDNASLDGETRRVALEHGASYLYEPRPGLDFARNLASRQAKGTWLAFFDDDVVVDRGWLDAFAETLVLHPDAAVVTGQVLPLTLDTEAQVLFERHGGFRRGFQPVRYGGTLPGSSSYPAGAGYFGTGANMVVRTDVLQALGGFDEALDTGPPLPGGGDLDLFYRAIRAGHVLVYEPRCLVLHDHRRDMVALRRQYGTGWGTSFMAFFAKSYNTDPSFRPQLRRYLRTWAQGIMRELLDSVSGRSIRPPDLVLTEIVGALRGLCGEYGRSLQRSQRIRDLSP